MRKLIVTLLLMSPAIAQAGPWCLVRDENENCGFSSPEQCYNAVAVAGGYCRENAREIGARGTARWCLVTSTYRYCSYRFKTQCLREARAKNGGCVENIEQALYFSTVRDDFQQASCQGDIGCEQRVGIGGGADGASGGQESAGRPAGSAELVVPE